MIQERVERFNPVWMKVAGMLAVMFFVYLSDGILSDFAPSFMQEKLGSSLLMGLVMSFSSVVGFGADMIFPQWLKGTSVRKLMVLAIASSLGFVAVLFLSTFWAGVAIFLLAMAVWGMYYEFLGFAGQQFVAEAAPANMRSAVWAVLGVFRSLAYFLGPLISGVLAETRGDRSLLLVCGGLTMLGLASFTVGKPSKNKVEVEVKEINIWRELSHWRVLFVHVWPILVMSLSLGLLDSFFWTTGTVWNDVLASKSPYGGFFLSLYIMPSLFVGLIVAKWGVTQGKKRLAQIFFILGSGGLALIGLSSEVWWQLLVVFLSSSLLAVSGPLLDAVYTDVVVRMGRERKHLMGLSSCSISLAYVIGPILAGGLASMFGEQKTFMLGGMGAVVVGVVLLLTTPKKLHLPQQDIESWSD